MIKGHAIGNGVYCFVVITNVCFKVKCESLLTCLMVLCSWQYAIIGSTTNINIIYGSVKESQLHTYVYLYEKKTISNFPYLSKRKNTMDDSLSITLSQLIRLFSNRDN